MASESQLHWTTGCAIGRRSSWLPCGGNEQYEKRQTQAHALLAIVCACIFSEARVAHQNFTTNANQSNERVPLGTRCRRAHHNFKLNYHRECQIRLFPWVWPKSHKLCFAK